MAQTSFIEKKKKTGRSESLKIKRHFCSFVVEVGKLEDLSLFGCLCAKTSWLCMSCVANAHARVPPRVASSSLRRWEWMVVNVRGNNCRTEMCAADVVLVLVCVWRREFLALRLGRNASGLNEKWRFLILF